MEQSTFKKFQELIRQSSGISLSEEKLPLLLNRINKRLRALHLSDPKDYLEIVLGDSSGKELIQLLDAISTNVTHFYREKEHFVALAEALKEMETAGAKKFRIWCAASSSGEEPYTIAISAIEALQLQRRAIDLRILATDISIKVLNQAVAGVYPKKQLEAAPAEILKQYFTKKSGENVLFEVKSEVKKYVQFKRLNLSSFPYPVKGPVDIIFCRNVMIYFERSLRQEIIKSFESILKPGGYLFLSRSENLLGITHNLRNVGVSVYRKQS